MRIDKKVPNTARYFYSAFWTLLADEETRWEVLHRALEELPSPLKQLTPIADSGRFGRRIQQADDYANFRLALLNSLGSPVSGLDGFVAALIAVREAQLCRDEVGYHYKRQWERAIL